MKHFLIARVSREDQIDALPAQKKRLFEYVNKKGETNYEYCEFNESAHTIETRKEFSKIIERIQKESKKQKVIVVFDKIDRFTRDSSQDEVRLFKKLISEDRIEVHFPHDNLFVNKYSPAADLFRLGIGMELAAYYANAIGDNVRRRFEQMVNDGYYPHQAPYGYKNINRGTEREPIHDIIIDEQKAQYIRMAYSLRLQQMSYDVICSALYDAGMRSNKGNKMSKSKIASILSDKFYIGIMTYKGKEHPHRYPHIIEEDVFYECQKVNDGRKHIPSKSDTCECYTFGNRLATCKRCGRTISCYTKKGNVYLRCAGNKICRNPNCSEKLLEGTITSVLSRISINKQLTDDIIDALKNKYANDALFKEQSKKAIQSEYDKICNQLEIAYEDRLNGSITINDYDKFATKLNARRDELERQMTKLNGNDDDLEINTSYLLDLVCRMEELYKSSKPELKNKLLRFLFSNLQIDDKKLYFELNDPFKTLGKGTKNGAKSGDPSSLAGPAGFEPANAGTKTQCLTAWRRSNMVTSYIISQRFKKQNYPYLSQPYLK